MTWQDIALASAQIVFAAALWATVRDPLAHIPRATSLPTALAMWAVVAVYASLGLWLAFVVAAAAAAAWSFVAAARADPVFFMGASS